MRTSAAMPPSRTGRVLLLAVACMTLLAGCSGSSTDDVANGSDDVAVDGDRSASAAPGAPMCAEDQPDCDDTIEPSGDDAASDRAAGSCLAGDEDCSDESDDRRDVTRPVTIVGDVTAIPAAQEGPTSGATGVRVTAAALVTDSKLALVFEAPACVAVEDVLVVESRAEVRLMVLLGPSTETGQECSEPGPLRVQVHLDEPLGDRALLDLAD